MVRVEETLASYLSHGMMFSLKDRFFLIDVFISPYGLFGIAMSTVIQRFIRQEFNLWHLRNSFPSVVMVFQPPQALLTLNQGLLLEEGRESQKVSVATHASPTRNQGAKRHAHRRSSKDLICRLFALEHLRSLTLRSFLGQIQGQAHCRKEWIELPLF